MSSYYQALTLYSVSKLIQLRVKSNIYVWNCGRIVGFHADC